MHMHMHTQADAWMHASMLPPFHMTMHIHTLTRTYTQRESRNGARQQGTHS